MRILTLGLCALLLTALPARPFNHPEIKWKTVGTTHFLIHYYDKTEAAVYATAKIAEEVYGPMADMYVYPFKDKIHISLADYDDYANGFADWTAGNIQIWLPDSRFDLRSNSTWLRNVITHELGHIVSLTKQGSQVLDWVFGLGYASPNVQVDLQSPVALAKFYPAWFVEGTAQRESERAGNDGWDSRRAMLLRCAVLDGTALSLDAMAYFSHDAIGDELVYNQGFSFVKFLESRFGAPTLAALWKEGRHGSFGGGSFDALFTAITGANLRATHDAWIDSLRAAYAAQKPAAPTAGKVGWDRGKFNEQPRVSPDGKLWGWLTSDKDDFGRTDLLVAAYGTSTAIARIQYAKTAWSFSSDGSKVFYVKSRENDVNGSFFNDIYSFDVAGQSETRLTTGARVYDIAALPDGKRLACVRFEKGVFSIAVCDIGTGRLTDVVAGELGEPFQGLSVDPGNPARLVTARVVDGQANLYIVHLDATTARRPADSSATTADTSLLTPLCGTLAQEESPQWARNGRIYFSADYDGIFNIYSIMPDGTDLQRHSQVTGGAFGPAMSGDGSIVCSEYTSSGFQIITIPGTGVSCELPASVVCTYQPLPRPKGRVRLVAKDYKPDRLRRTLELQSQAFLYDQEGSLGNMISTGEFGRVFDSITIEALTAISMFRSDALDKKSRALSLGLLFSSSMLATDEPANTDSVSSSMTRAASQALQSQAASLERKSQASSYAFRLHDRARASWINGAAHAAAAADTTGDSAASAPTIPFVISAFFQAENRTQAPTLGFQLGGYAPLQMPIPQILEGLFYADWHVARDLHVGFSPSIFSYPLALLVKVDVPLWISYETYGYVNEDMYYNLGGVTSAGINVAPGVEPVVVERDSIGHTDTTSTYSGALGVGVSFMHGFALGKYFSIVEAIELDVNYHGVKNIGTLTGPLTPPSRLISSLSNQLSFVFPVARNINSGRWYYLEDIYGRIFYQTSILANEHAFQDPYKEYLLERDFDPSRCVVSHVVGHTLTLGLSKAYTFARTLSLTVAYDAWNYEVFCAVKLGF